MKDRCINCFKSLSVPTRFKLFSYLKDHKKGATVNKLSEFIGLKQPTVTFHIDQLEKTGLVMKERNGREVYCKINKLCKRCFIFS